MTVPLALVPMSFLVSLPILVLPIGPIAVLGGAAALALLLSLLIGVRALLVAGTGLALIQYALALYLRGGAVDWVAAAAHGVMLALTLDTADFGIRFRRSHVTPAALRAQLRSWLAIVGASAAVCAVLAIAAAAGIGIPAGWEPIVAALAAIGATLGLAGALGSNRAS